MQIIKSVFFFRRIYSGHLVMCVCVNVLLNQSDHGSAKTTTTRFTLDHRLYGCHLKMSGKRPRSLFHAYLTHSLDGDRSVDAMEGWSFIDFWLRSRCETQWLALTPRILVLSRSRGGVDRSLALACVVGALKRHVSLRERGIEAWVVM